MEHEQSSRLQRAVLQVIGVHLMRQPVETEASWRGIFGPNTLLPKRPPRPAARDGQHPRRQRRPPLTHRHRDDA